MKFNVKFSYSFQRGISCIKGDIKLRPLSTYLSGDTKGLGGLSVSGPEIEVSVPLLNLPGDPTAPLSCTGSTGSQLELGAAGMLQVSGNC